MQKKKTLKTTKKKEQVTMKIAILIFYKNLTTVNLEQNLLIYQTAYKTEKMIMKKKKLVPNKTKRHFQRKMLRKDLTENVLVTIKNPW